MTDISGRLGKFIVLDPSHVKTTSKRRFNDFVDVVKTLKRRRIP